MHRYLLVVVLGMALSTSAGIVGVKKFAYDIWGDTVNTAARMEQKTEAAKINISQKTYDLVRD